jgi:hypothetical protein
MKRRQRHWRFRLAGMMRDALMRELRLNYLDDEQLESYAAAIVKHEQEPYALVSSILAEWKQLKTREELHV